ERGVELRDGLHRLDGAEDLVLADLLALGGEVEEDDVAELALGVVGDADGHDAGVVGLLHVLVVLRVEEVLRDRRHERLRAGGGETLPPGRAWAWSVMPAVTVRASSLFLRCSSSLGSGRSCGIGGARGAGRGEGSGFGADDLRGEGYPARMRGSSVARGGLEV